MRRILSVTLASALALPAAASLVDDPANPQAGPPAAEPKAADADAPLPEGFPSATRPGAIEVKSYPAYRSAVAKGDGMTTASGDFLFWSLFRHIETKGVAMTAPVINTFESERMLDEPSTRGRVTMEFLYRQPDQGETGAGVGAVEVVDHPAGQYVCLGVQGRMGPETMKQGLDQLRRWLDQHQAEWTAAGSPRRLGYHGPMTPADQRLWELQIPIRSAPKTGEGPVAAPAAP